jgi:hypothetical protein
MDWRRRKRPVPVTLKRLAAPLSVFCFGICNLSGLHVPLRTPRARALPSGGQRVDVTQQGTEGTR